MTSDRPPRALREVCGSRDSSVDIVTVLRTGQLRSRGSIPGRDTGQELSVRLWGPQASYSVLRVKRPGLRMSGAIPLPLPTHVVEWAVNAVKWLGRVGNHVPTVRMSGTLPPVHRMA